MNTKSGQWTRLIAFLGGALLCLAPGPSLAQNPPNPAPAATPAGAESSAAAAQEAAGIVIKKESKLVLVDAVVMDKKGNYVRDLEQKDFKVYEDNKEQPVVTFSSGANAATQPGNNGKRYLILFFDNSSMATPDQIQARGAAAKFIQDNAGPDHLMAVVDFGGSLRIVQNFTANGELLKAAVTGVKTAYVASNPSAQDAAGQAVSGPAFGGLSAIGNSETDFGARTMLLAVRSLAKNLRGVPGRKMLILFSAGFVLTPENESELTATIDACNKANVAIYSLDVRGLVSGTPGVSQNQANTRREMASAKSGNPDDRSRGAARFSSNGSSRLVLASYSAGMGEPQHPGGGGGGAGGGGGHPGGGGGTGGGTSGGGGRGGAGGTGTGGGGNSGTGGGKGGGTTGGTGGTRGGGNTGYGGYANNGYNPYNPYNPNSPYNQSRMLVPQMSSVATNQQILAALADGTGGFSIFNTNDLLGGLERIGREQNEFYIVGYIPPESPEGSCHALKVKLERGGMNVRSRTGYCNARAENPLDGKPVEKQLELRAAGGQAGSIHGSMQTPYFYAAPNIARVNLSMDIPGDSLTFNKDKGKYHASVDVLGIAYLSDGSIGAKFSDTFTLDLEKDEWKAFTKNPYHYHNQFDAAPGSYNLTVVLSGGGDTFGKFQTPLRIESYDGKKFDLGGVVLTSSLQRISDIPTGIDSQLLEDRTPLVVGGMQVVPSASNRFKRSDNVVLYTEIYEPLLTSASPPRVAFAYRIFDRASNKELFFSNIVPADSFVQKGNPVIPAAARVQVKDLTPGTYRLVVQAVDSAKNNAPNRTVDFDISD